MSEDTTEAPIVQATVTLSERLLYFAAYGIDADHDARCLQGLAVFPAEGGGAYLVGCDGSLLTVAHDKGATGIDKPFAVFGDDFATWGCPTTTPP